MDHPMSLDGAFDETVTILVGSPATTFVMYTAAAKHDSEFIRAALERDWKEAREHKIELPEVKAPTFVLFTRWVMTRSLKKHRSDVEQLSCTRIEKRRAASRRNASGGNKSRETGGANAVDNRVPSYQTTTTEPQTPKSACNPAKVCCHHRRIRTYLDAYILGDVLMSTGFKNAALDEMIEFSEMHGYSLSMRQIEHLYEHTTEKSFMRKLVVDQLVWSSADNILEQGKDWPVEFLQSVANAWMRTRRLRKRGQMYCESDAPYYDDICENYHEHKPGFVRPCKETLSYQERQVAKSPAKAQAKIQSHASWAYSFIDRRLRRVYGIIEAMEDVPQVGAYAGLTMVSALGGPR